MVSLKTPVGLLVRLASDENNPLAERHRAFGDLVRRFQDMAFGCAYALVGDATLAEEAAQEAFVSAWRHLGQLREADAFPGWFKRIIVTRCYRLMQQNHSQSTLVPLTAALGLAAPEKEAPLEQLLHTERTAQVRAAIAELPEQERLALLLFYVGDYSRQEVAAFLGISPAAVKKRLAAARARLKERLSDTMRELNELRPSHNHDFASRVLGFTKLFSALVDSGVGLLASLDRLAAQETDNDFRAAITQIRADLAGGSCLSQAMGNYPRFFSERYLALIREGEETGELDVALNRLTEIETPVS